MSLNLMNPIRQVMREDPILQTVVGYDQDGEVKVYTSVGKSDAEAPWVVLTMLSSTGPTGTYGDDYVWEPFQMQVSSWGSSERHAWQVADVVDDAILKAPSWSFEPYYLAKVMRSSTPMPLPDRDTNLVQILVLYTFMIGR